MRMMACFARRLSGDPSLATHAVASPKNAVYSLVQLAAVKTLLPAGLLGESKPSGNGKTASK